MPPVDPDLSLRQAAVATARELAHRYDDLVPLARLREGFEDEGRRISLGSFYKGIHRSTAQRGPAALTLTTSIKDPYADAFDTVDGSFIYAYRAGAIDQPDNRALRAAFELQTPLVYFRALAAGQYLVVVDPPATFQARRHARLPPSVCHLHLARARARRSGAHRSRQPRSAGAHADGPTVNLS